ncbi:MAG: EcsC family protein [Deltaproteobacteria bacterium]|nr:EcsC family protein [Deltaproteobacteria bacterium]
MTRLSGPDQRDLRRAKRLLERTSLAIRISNVVGLPIERGIELLPRRASALVTAATRRALETALRFALVTLDDAPGARSADLWHKVLVTATGAGGGLFGMPALAIELPVSTTLMLRSIADVARSEGERLRLPETRLACLQVFALGGRTQADDAAESAYFAIRGALARALAEAAQFVAERGLAREGAPAVVRFLTQIAARYGMVVSEKTAAQALPLLGAAGGAVVNALFMDHFQDVARGHFIVRRLERAYDPEAVRRAYVDLA